MKNAGLGLLVGVLVLGRVWLAPHESMAGDAFLDGMGTQWFYALPGWVLEGRSGLVHTDMLFYPWGKEVFLHTGGNLVDALLAWPLRAVFGPILGYNLFVLGVFALNAFAGGRLASAFRIGRVGQGIAAVLFSLSPYFLVELEQGRPTQALAAFIALAFAALLERRGLAAGLWLGLAGWTYWYAGVVAGTCAVLLLPIALLEPGRRQTLVAWALAGVTCGLMVAPAAVPMLAGLGEGSVPGLLAVEQGRLLFQTVEGDSQSLFVTDFLGQAGVLSSGGFLVGARLLGPVQLLAAVAGVVALRRRSLPLLVLVVVGLIVGAGPQTGLYEGVAVEVGLLRRWWWPMRGTVVVHLAVAVLAAAAIARLSRAWPRRQLGLGIVLALAWPLGHAPLSSWEAAFTGTSDCLAGAPEGAVIDLPLAKDQRHLWQQVGHGKPQLGGMLSRKPSFGSKEVDALLRTNGFAEELVALGAGDFLRGGEELSGRSALIDLGYRYVLVRQQAYVRPSATGTRSDYPRLERALLNRLGPPASRDEGGDNALTLWTLDGTSLSCP